MSASPTDILNDALAETRARFVAAFPAQCDSIRILVDKISDFGADGPVAALVHITHRLSGLAGTIGFPGVGRHASELEDLAGAVGRGAFDARLARRLVDSLHEAFATDLANPSMGTGTAMATVRGTTILVADASGQHDVLTGALQRAGYEPMSVAAGDMVVAVARAERPGLILLDLEMPRLDGRAVCRLLKLDPDLAAVPIIVMTDGAKIDDRLAALALGADEFLGKPVDTHELVLRIQRLLDRRWRSGSGATGASRELTYEAFLAVANEELGRAPAAVAIVRLSSDRHEEGSRLLAGEIRGRDSLGAFGLTRLLILMPGMTAIAARDRIAPMVERLIVHGLDGVCAGVTASPGFQTRTAEDLVGEADEALAEARHLGENTAIWSQRPGWFSAPRAARNIVIAEDDPDVSRIVDAVVRATGYKAIVAIDGDQALAAVRAHAPDVLVLDLIMPKRDGFDVLARIHEGPPPRPRIIVVSARGRDQDVMRAFELGADDYMTKPFDPQELMARIARLLK